MNELDVARAIASGAAPSPSRCGNAWLFAIRVSGSGIAERSALKEVTYRCPGVWTSDEMLARAAGLPVVLGHPVTKTLTGDEYALRNIGTIVLPFARGGELWGVARVIDTDAAGLMLSGEFSTSPCARCDAGVAVQGDDGRLFVEGPPTFLDHVAIVPNKGGIGGGVWDKGGPGSGIRIDSTSLENETMAEENDGKKPVVDTGADDPMKKVMDGIGALADAIASMGKRLDAIEKPPEEKLDAVPDPAKDAGLVRRDGAEIERKEQSDFANAQERCDSVMHGFGRQAPPPMRGETVLAYRCRLARQFQPHSSTWKDMDLSKLAPEFLSLAEGEIYADAMEAARNPTDVPVGQLRCIRKRDESGREIKTFFGDQEACWGQFKIPPRKATFVKQSAA